MSVESLLKHVPENLRYYRQPIPDEQNALTPWREAVAQYVAPDEDDVLWGSLVYGRDKNDDPDNESSSEPESVPFPTGAEAKRIQDILDANRRAIELLDEGIALGQLQLPVSYPPLPSEEPGSNKTLDLPELNHLNQLRCFRAKALASQGDLLAAAEDLIAVLRIGQLLCHGEGDVIPHLWSYGFLRLALDTIERFLEAFTPPPHVCRRLLATVEEAQQQPDGLANTLRVKLRHDVLPSLDAIPETDDVETLVDAYLGPIHQQTLAQQEKYSSKEMIAPNFENPLQQRRDNLLFVLKGHPKPFDKVATLRIFTDEFGRRIEAIDASARGNTSGPRTYWRRFRAWCAENRLRHQLDVWRGIEVLTIDLEYFFKHLPPTSELLKIQRGDVPKDQLPEVLRPPTQSQLTAIRKRVQRAANPFGLYWTNLALGSSYMECPHRSREWLASTARLLRSRLG